MTDEIGNNGLDKTRSFSVITHGMAVAHYRIEKKIGAGGMGEVFLAEDTRLNRKVALKFLPAEFTTDPDVKARFTREAQAAAAFNHPNVITVYEVAEFQNRLFLAMEYVEGDSLKDLIAEKELRVSEIVDFAMQICQGLAKAHQVGIVHRDIKPQNILIDRDGRVRIVDFGLAKLKGDMKLTQIGSTLGTVSYMSPEQAQGEEVDRRSDIFSLGVMLYEMITGRLPFQGEHQAAILNSILNEQPQLPSRYNNRISQELERIVFKALAKDRNERYQHVDDFLADLRREQKISEHLRSSQLSGAALATKPKRNLLRFLLPASVVFLLLLLLLILKPFQVEITPEKMALAEERSLAVMYFENLADPADENRLGQMITSLLITDLSESQYFMRVVSRQRLYDILKLLGKEDLKKIDKTVASEVAKKAEVRWILTGDILQIEPNIVLTSDISDPVTGEILATWRVNGEKGEDIFSVIDKLTAQIKADLSLPSVTKKGLEKSVADVTTHSPEAYRYYLEGLDNYNKAYFADAARSYEKALEYDSTFAMAYFRLALIKQGEERRKNVTKAMQYSDNVSKKEKLYIRILEAGTSGNTKDYSEGLQKMTEYFPDDKEIFQWLASYYYGMKQNDLAITYFNRALEIDPVDKMVLNMLAYAYNQVGDFDKSIWAINKYISVAPDEANPYDTRGDLYAWSGRVEQAMDSYRKAIEKKPNFFASWRKLGHMHLFKREYAEAESCYKELTTSEQKDIRSEGRACLAYIPAYQGKFKEANRILDEGLAADRMEQAEGEPKIRKHSLKGLVYLEEKRGDLARQEIEKAIEISRKAFPESKILGRQHYVYALAASGELEKARQVAQTLRNDIGKEEEGNIYYFWYAEGCIDFFKGDFEKSIVNFEKASEHIDQLYAHFMLARAYQESNQLDKAVSQLEGVLSQYNESRAVSGIWAVKAHYLLGLAYERSGWNSKAAEQFDEFLKIWKNADPGIPEIKDAKERLARLKSRA